MFTKPIRVSRVKRLGTIAAFLSLCFCVLVATRTDASAAPRLHTLGAKSQVRPYGVDQRMYALMMAQIPLDKAATQIQLAVTTRRIGRSGFFNTEVNDARHLLIVRWHGAMPADIARLIHRLSSRVHIRVAPAAYSFAALENAISKAKRIDPAVGGGYPLTDGSGIHLYVRASSLRPATAVVRARLRIPVTASPARTVSLQATCIPNPNDHLGPGSRCWDLSPDFWGGDVIINQYGFGCTGGFGVHDSRGGLYMLTAAHCAETPTGTYANGVHFTNGNDTANMGYITDVPGTLDGAVIPTSAGKLYYDGPGVVRGSDTTRTKHVVGQLATSVNDYLCESGSFGGVVCAMQVTATGVSLPNDPWNNLALANSLGGTLSIGGDSGGPWFSLAGTGTVNAQGIHHGLYGRQEIFTPISVLSYYMGVWVNT